MLGYAALSSRPTPANKPVNTPKPNLLYAFPRGSMGTSEGKFIHVSVFSPLHLAERIILIAAIGQEAQLSLVRQDDRIETTRWQSDARGNPAWARWLQNTSCILPCRPAIKRLFKFAPGEFSGVAFFWLLFCCCRQRQLAVSPIESRAQVRIESTLAD